mmetsp:Transcript_58206/g.153058  ORF Transcript_58206/g.153058 Transcript_58206/m.153058 type:complete len:94 (-) Transcript_58206:3153-3434(-)
MRHRDEVSDPHVVRSQDVRPIRDCKVKACSPAMDPNMVKLIDADEAILERLGELTTETSAERDWLNVPESQPDVNETSLDLAVNSATLHKIDE